MPKIAPFLWFDGDAEEAANFYAATFPSSAVTAVHHAPGDYPAGKHGDVLTVEFTVLGMPCVGLNGGSGHPHTDAFSFSVETETQKETDRYWSAITGNGGAEIACGWCRDRWGVHWQITPRILNEGFTHADPVVAKRVFDAMMTMVKIDHIAIEVAIKG